MSFSRDLSVISFIAVVGCAQFDSARPFVEDKANDLHITTTAKHEARESPGPLHTSGLGPMAGMAPDMQTAPTQAVPDPIGGEKNTGYWTKQYTNHEVAAAIRHEQGCNSTAPNARNLTYHL